MRNHKLSVGVALALCDLAGCTGQQEQVLRERQNHDAECRKFGSETGTPARANCRMALHVIESIERTPRSPVPDRLADAEWKFC